MNGNFIDLLMVFPPSGRFYNTSFKYNLGPAYIIAYLRENGFNAEQFISNEAFNSTECARKIISYNPRVIGFTVYDTNFMQSVIISRKLKIIKPNVIIIFGGPTPSVQGKEILENINSVDICVRGEGEETVFNLLSNLSKNKYNLKQTDLLNIQGINYRKNNVVITTPDSNVLSLKRNFKNYLDNYPSPYLSKVIPASEAFPVGIITARGCNQNCVYCNCAVMSKRNISFHSIERVLEELLYLNEHKEYSRPIPINDDTFTVIPSRAKKICELIIDNKIELPLGCMTRCDRIDEELIDLMKQAGFLSLGFSLESAVPRVLRAIGKVKPPDGLDLGHFEKELEFIEKLKTMTAYAKKVGMDFVYVSIMSGLPTETPNDAQKTIELANQLDIDSYVQNNLCIFKGTPLYQNYKEFGYKVKPIGNKNEILICNNFPFDVFGLKITSKSGIRENNNDIIDYNTLKILSLNTQQTRMGSFFNNVIILSNKLKQTQVKWIQENLAIGGSLIHIYSNELEFKKFYERNLKTLYNEFSPTLCYDSYFCTNSHGASTLKSARKTFSDENINILIKLKCTDHTLGEYDREVNNMESTICQDLTPNDSQTLHNLLTKIFKSKDRFNLLLESKPLPYFQSLCRWTSDLANCKQLETAIMGSDGSIRICWFSEPIGTINSSFSEITQHLSRINKELIKERNCEICSEYENCIKCMFPQPLSSEGYCNYRKKFNTNEPAKVINSFSVFKEILFKPILLIDI